MALISETRMAFMHPPRSEVRAEPGAPVLEQAVEVELEPDPPTVADVRRLC